MSNAQLIRRTLYLAIVLSSLNANAEPTLVSIPPGDLAAALEAFAKQADIELVFSADQLKGLRTRGVEGALTPEQAVSKLIEGTSLTITVDSSGAMLIAPPRSKSRSTFQQLPSSNTRYAAVAAPPVAIATASPANTIAPDAAEVAEEVTVIGTRASLQSAIERKKRAGTVVDSIVAEDVAQFPDKNIGEALQRVTGIQLERNFGEGTAVSIRGMEPDLNRVEVNGVSTLSATAGRSADFREFASELVKSIDVFKGYTADLTEGGIGGTVSIQMRRPLELQKSLFSATASGQYLDTAETTRPRGNLTLADKFFADRFGFILNVTYDHVDTRGDFIRNTDWVRLADFDSATRPTDKTTVNPLYESYPTFASCSEITVATDRTACETQFYDYSPRIPRYGLLERNDKRTSGQLTLQYQVTEDLDIWAEGQLNYRDQRLIDNNYSVDLGAVTRIRPGSVRVDENHNVIGAATTALSGFSSGRRDFSYDQNSTYLSSGFNWSSGAWTVTGLGATSEAETSSESNSLGFRAVLPDLEVNLDPSNGVPYFLFPNGFDPLDPGSYNGDVVLQYRPEEYETTERQAKLDFDWKVDLPLIDLVEFGAQYRSAQSLHYNGGGHVFLDGRQVPSANVNQTAVIGPLTDLSNPASPVWDRARLREFVAATGILTSGLFFDNDSVNRAGLPDRWLTPDFARVGDWFDLSNFNHALVRSANGIAQIPAHDIEETISAVYLKGNFEAAVFKLPVRGNIGVRYTQTDDEATGAHTIRERRPTPGGGFTDVTLGKQATSIRNEYSDVLPSFNVSVQLRPDLMSRFGWAKVLARPKPTDLAPNANCLYDRTSLADGTLDSCTAGNPDLQPYRATQYDLDLAWYPNADTLFSAALFYKDVTSFVLASTLVQGVDLFHDGVLYDVRQPINGAGAKISGLELSAQTALTFLPAPFNGFGTVLNYTRSRATEVGLFHSLTGEELGFPGLSKHSYNAIVYYNTGGLDVRVAYNARTDWLESVAERSGNPAIRDGSAYLDGKITYRFRRPDIALFVEAKNLTREVERTSSGDIRLSELSYPGRRYFVGFSYKL